MKESAKAKKLRIKNALAALQAAYPDARPQLDSVSYTHLDVYKRQAHS